VGAEEQEVEVVVVEEEEEEERRGLLVFVCSFICQTMNLRVLDLNYGVSADSDLGLFL
jgi:hypothetical protein